MNQNKLSEKNKDNAVFPLVSKCVVIMLHDCSREGMKNIVDKYDAVDCNTGIILFTGTGEECKAKYPNYVKPHFR